MNIFPEIKTIDDLYSKVKHLEEIRFKEHDNGCTVACYMIGNNELFSGEYASYAKECRGITFGPDGLILSRPLQKFFNVGERLDTQDDLINWNTISSIQDKRDGSLISPVLLNNKIIFKSKKSFESDVANQVNKLFATGVPHPLVNKLWYSNEYALSYDLQKYGFTPIFEFTSPLNRIVLNYQEEKLVLLHIRNTITGEYLSRKRVTEFASMYKVQVVDEYNIFNSKELKDGLKTAKDLEGYVFQFENGDMVKMKSTWYLELHHSVTFPTYRSIAEMVLHETLDDFKSYLTEVQAFETFEKVLEIENKVVAELLLLQDEVEYMVRTDKELSVKDFAIKNKDNKLFHLAMMLYKGKEPSYNDFYEKYYLKENFELRQI